MHSTKGYMGHESCVLYVSGTYIFTEHSFEFKSKRLQVIVNFSNINCLTLNKIDHSIKLITHDNSYYHLMLPKPHCGFNMLIEFADRQNKFGIIMNPLVPKLLFTIILIYIFFALPISHILLTNKMYDTLSILQPSLLFLFGLMCYFTFIIVRYKNKLKEMPFWKLMILNICVPFIGHAALSKYFSRVIWHIRNRKISG